MDKYLLAQALLVRELLEADPTPIDSSLAFRTPYTGRLPTIEDGYIRCFLKEKTPTIESINAPIPAPRTPLDGNLIDLTSYYGHHCRTMRVVAFDDAATCGSNLMRVKSYVPPDKLAYFDLQDCFYCINPILLPEPLRALSTMPLRLDLYATNADQLFHIYEYNRYSLDLQRIRRGDYSLVHPKRWLVATFEIADWFSRMAITENPHLAACYVDDCFCHVDDLVPAKQWFIDRGFLINNKTENWKLQRMAVAAMRLGQCENTSDSE